MDHHTTVRSSDADASFDHYARLVRRFLRVPTAMVTIVEADRQIFPGASGLQESLRSTRQTPISHSYCQYVVADQQPMFVSDARQDRRLATNPAIADYGAIAYAGWPVVDGDGSAVGSLCAIDTKPREWNDEETLVLKDLALACSAELQHSKRMVSDSESLARAIFDSINVAVAFYDPHGDLLLANDRALRVATAAGYRLDRPPYTGPHVRGPDNNTPVAPADQAFPRALRGDVRDHEMEWLGTPGNEIAIVTTARAVKRGDESLWGTLIAGHDVTDLARALQDLRHATDAAESANKAKSLFLANMSHELRTPLTSLLATAEMLEDTDPTPLQTEMLDTLKRSGLRLRALIESILDFTKIEAGEIDLSPVAFDLRAMVADVVAAAAAERPAMTRGLTLRSNIEPRLPKLVVADRERLQQVLGTLVNNAIKFTHEGAVTVTVLFEHGDSKERPNLVLKVADTGIGILSKHHDSVFEPFTQIDPSMTRHYEGSGLGLALCKELVTRMEGEISVRSTPGQGCTFTLRLPVRLP